ncbi:MAG: hypothetical protein A3J46_04185 [Candidatus Yanofskybacteria bacterium RIFCSPHIGHO2_02_FULL_41_11]|uniref:Uncharacterized protein n=1 Tax=Candidatus Yanofskybacteria bacterium RIFCSPHIGHO2_02_FULL_41_11 TaxID=1802675 RepID=A0A1F8FF94_9BACT|nr:MAG: hypothetical protein A3J46_04185 [Candidatus Yanofskybacteria bacterium RIFCSPHIGHO2_02_FULL_41_11]
MTEKEPKLETKEKTRSLEKLLDLVLEKGSPDLLSISPPERAVILGWYKSSELSEKEKVDFMEEFMHYDLVDDANALEFIRLMNGEQKNNWENISAEL